MADTKLVIPQLGNRFIDDRKRVWGDSFNWAFTRPFSDVKYLVIHHSVTSPYIFNSNGTIKREKTWQEQVDEIASLHKARGWAGIGYHLVITTQGIVAYVGDIGTGRANVLNHNEAVIGINLVGDFTKHLPTDIQINSAHDLCDFFLFNYPPLLNTNGWEDVIGHKDCASIWNNTTVTACPGSSWPFDMKSRIKDNVIYSQAPAIPIEEPTVITEPTPIPPSPPEPDESGDSVSDTPSVVVPSEDVSVGNVDIPPDVDNSPDVSVPQADEKVHDILQTIKAFFGSIVRWFR